MLRCTALRCALPGCADGPRGVLWGAVLGWIDWAELSWAELCCAYSNSEHLKSSSIEQEPGVLPSTVGARGTPMKWSWHVSSVTRSSEERNDNYRDVSLTQLFINLDVLGFGFVCDCHVLCVLLCFVLLYSPSSVCCTLRRYSSMYITYVSLYIYEAFITIFWWDQQHTCSGLWIVSMKW